MALTTLQIFTGLFSIIILLIYLLVGLLIIFKYSINKNKTFIWWGIGLLGIGLAWLGSSVSFLMILMTGKGLSTALYFFLMTTWMPITLFFWMWTMTELMAKEKQNIILGIYAVIGIMFDSYLIYYLITEPSVIGTLETPPIDVTYRGITMIYVLFVIASIAISLFIFIGKSLKTDNPEIKLKAKILLVALITYLIGSTADAFVPLTIVTLLLTRIIVIVGAIGFYLGWNLPEPLKKLFLKE